MSTKTTKARSKALSRFEAQLVADWLKQKGKQIGNGWLSVYRLSPDAVAKKFSVSAEEVVKAARREDKSDFPQGPHDWYAEG